MNDKHLLDMPPDKMEGEVAVSLFFEDDRPLVGAAALIDWRLNGHLTKQLQNGSVSGALRDMLLVQNNGKLDSEWALLIGGGQRKKLSPTVWSRLLLKIFRACSQAGFSRVAICLDTDGSFTEKEITTLVNEVFSTGKFTDMDYLLTLVPVSFNSNHSD